VLLPDWRCCGVGADAIVAVAAGLALAGLALAGLVLAGLALVGLALALEAAPRFLLCCCRFGSVAGLALLPG
jgi:hypothetical protein